MRPVGWIVNLTSGFYIENFINLAYHLFMVDDDVRGVH